MNVNVIPFDSCLGSLGVTECIPWTTALIKTIVPVYYSGTVLKSLAIIDQHTVMTHFKKLQIGRSNQEQLARLMDTGR